MRNGLLKKIIFYYEKLVACKRDFNLLLHVALFFFKLTVLGGLGIVSQA
jgi:hypothetical protein